MPFLCSPSRSRPTVFAAYCTLLGVGSIAALAAPLRVDINNSGRPVHEGLDRAFTPWSASTTWFSGGDRTSATFGEVTATFTRVGPHGSALQTGYWKSGVQNPSGQLKLISDGLKVTDGEAGARIKLRLSGLSAGPHSLLLHLNNWDGEASVAPLDISVDGAQVLNDLPVSTRAADPARATTAYLTFTAHAGRDVVVLIGAETGGDAKSRNVHINGFELDTPDSKAQAVAPVPAHADEHVDADTGSLTLRWSPPVRGAASHDLYVGSSEAAVAAATRSSPEFRGNITADTYALSGLGPHQAYHWRVDSLAADGTTTPGKVWTFRPRRLAFPGAEGYGRHARGGRGGVVVHVTNLHDSGPGSLRDAIEGDYGPRTVIFDVGGLITLENDIVIDGSRPPITVAGQTAPGKGVAIKRQQFALSGARDAIVRFLRIFPGKESGETQNATGMAGVDHCIMDHVSFGWGLDEAISTRGAKNLSLQRCFISESLNIAGHQNYPEGTKHGYAASVGGDIASLHHNLLAHNEGRNWSMAGGLDGSGRYAGRLDIFNNVVYNWGGRTTDGGAHEVNFVNNYYKPGPATSKFTVLNPQYGGFPGTQRYYMAGNIMPGKFDARDQATGRAVGTENKGTLPENSTPPYSPWAEAPFFPSHATIHTAANAYKQVLSDVGCNQPQTDAHDARIIGETLAGTATYKGGVSGKPGLPDTTDDVGGWEDYGTPARSADWDGDRDGLPDWWERIHGTDTRSPARDFSDSNADPDGDGYTNLEDYLDWMASPHAACAPGASIEIDLHSLARGYLQTRPRFTFASPTHGTVTLVRGRYARFTPSPTAAALGGFAFTVTDSAGDSMTRRIGIRILAP